MYVCGLRPLNTRCISLMTRDNLLNVRNFNNTYVYPPTLNHITMMIILIVHQIVSYHILCGRWMGCWHIREGNRGRNYIVYRVGVKFVSRVMLKRLEMLEMLECKKPRWLTCYGIQLSSVEMPLNQRPSSSPFHLIDLSSTCVPLFFILCSNYFIYLQYLCSSSISH